MQFIQGTNRHQTYFTALEQQVAGNNPVRIVDVFVEKLDLQKLVEQQLLLSEASALCGQLPLAIYTVISTGFSSRKWN
jgi:hypothetical protein